MAELTTYTRADVKTRDGRGGAPAWIIIRDVVYDVTNYANEHPGGASLVLDEAGKDATRDFDDAGHSSDATSILRKYKIGELIEEDKHYDANGKKKKRVVKAAADDAAPRRSCTSVITCGLLG